MKSDSRFRAGAIPAVAAAVLHVAGASAQSDRAGAIEGDVRDGETGRPLAGALVVVDAIGAVAVSSGDGAFRIAVPDQGSYAVRVERLGYRTRALAVEASKGEALAVEMEASPIALPGVVATGSLGARAVHEALRPASVFAGDKLQRRLAGTLASTLATEPGLTVGSMGPNAEHPVVRGLSGDRVLLLEDGQRIGDEYASAADHATALGPSTARRVEVVRGPGAVLYGSNALGGVVNVVRDEVPSAVPDRPTGMVTLQGGTAASAVGASGSAAFGLTDRVAGRLGFALRSSGDLKTPLGALPNTDGDVAELAAGASWVDRWGRAGASFRYYDNDYGIPGGFVGGHTAGVRIDMKRAATRLESLIRPAAAFETIEIDAGHTWYRHLEVEPPDILGTIYERQTASGKALARHAEWGPFSSGAVGARASWERMGTGGSLYTPNSTQTTFAAFALEEIELDPVRLEAGLRYDWTVVRPDREDPSSDIGHIRTRSFGALSGSFGVLGRLTGRLTVGGAVARAFRSPSVTELFSEGPHLAVYSFDVGNPSLEIETGTGVDLFVRYVGSRFSAEATAFRNGLSGYVFPVETGGVSRVLLPIFKYVGEDASLQGFEGAFQWAPVGAFAVEAAASYVRGEIEATKRPLPRMPPLQARVSVGYAPRSWFLEVATRMAARQDRTGFMEEATDGYAVFDLSTGIRMTLGGRLHSITIRGENVGDAEYRNHLSRVKEIMPGAGRSVTAAYRVVF